MINTSGSNTWRAKSGCRGQRLDFYQQRSRSFHTDRNGCAGGARPALVEEDCRGIGNLDHAFALHFKNTHFMSRAKAVFRAAQEAIGMEAFAFEIEDGIHNM